MAYNLEVMNTSLLYKKTKPIINHLLKRTNLHQDISLNGKDFLLEFTVPVVGTKSQIIVEVVLIKYGMTKVKTTFVH